LTVSKTKSGVKELSRLSQWYTVMATVLLRSSAAYIANAVFFCDFKGTLRRRLSHGYFSFIAKYTSN